MITTKNGKTTAHHGLAGRISFGYALIAGLWVYASDTLVDEMSTLSASDERLHMCKGWLFVAVTALLVYGIVLLVVRIAKSEVPAVATAALKAGKEARPPWTQQLVVPLLIFVALALVIGAAGWLIYSYERASVRRDGNAAITAVADLKVVDISRWFRERRSYARLIASDPFLAAGLRRWLADGAPPDGQREQLVAWLGDLRQAMGFESLAIVDANARALLNSGPVALDEQNYRRIAAALASGDVVVSDLYRVDGAESGSSIALDITAPIKASNLSEGMADKLLLMRINAAQYLFPLLRGWPTPNLTGETVLVRREGDDILFLNPLPKILAPPMTVRRSVNDPDLPTAKAFRGVLGVGEGIDYRGVPVLAATRRVPGTGWLMVAQIDADEIYAPLCRITVATTMIVVVCIIASGAGIALWWSQQRARWYAASLRTRLERQALVRHFDYLAKYANDIILLSDERGRLVEVNARAEQAYGRSREELVGWPINALHDSFSTVPRQAVALQPAEGQVFETQHRRRDGSLFPVEVSTRTIDVEGRQFRHSIVRDISDRVHAEKRARDLDEQLRRVGIANELGQMISSLAHELRQPLTAAMNYVNACCRLLKVHPSPPAKALAVAEKAAEQIRRADLFVSDLRAFIQNQAPEYTAESIAVIIDETMEIALIGAAHLGIAVHCWYADNLPPVQADRIRIQQVVLNLVRNAIEAMTSTSRREIDVETRLRSPQEVLVSVADTGTGITPEVAERLFEPFVTSKAGGIGIGLAVCRSIIEAHGGRLWAEEAPSGGTIFRFTLPVATAGAGAGA